VTEALVIGAGVSGLTTALCLAEAGHAVRIRTEALPQQTTSRAAGAMWGSTFAGPADKVEGWARASLDAFRELAGDPASGVAIVSGTLASSRGGAPPPEMFPGVEVRRSDPPAGYAAGFRVTLPLIDMPRYLDHLAARVEAAGIPIALRPVHSLAGAPVVVNCTGVGATRVVHNYGHGGTGVGLSWGCAREVVALVAA
jgi:D-amino-acid oxidase